MKIKIKLSVLLLGAITACGAPKKIWVRSPSLRYLNSCDELASELQKTKSQFEAWDRWQSQRNGMEVLPVAQVGTSPASSNIVGNPQTKGVEEGDVVKLSQKYIYFVAGPAVQVLTRSDRSLVQAIRVDDLMNVKLFVEGSRLWVIGSSLNAPKRVELRSYTEQYNSVIPESSLSLSGEVLDTRVSNRKLILAVNSSLEMDKIDTASGFVEEVNCKKMSAPLLNDNDWNFTKLFSFDLTQAPKVIDAVSVVGAGQTLYMSEKNIYIIKATSTLCGWNGCDRFEGPDFRTLYGASLISKVHFDSHAAQFRLGSLGQVNGVVKDSWALQEYIEEGEEFLAVASTSNRRLCESGWCAEVQNENSLLVLKSESSQMVPVGAVLGFGQREDIRSVRYVDRMAYVVTFQKTDPLFSISLANLKEPKILAELKVPGFSTYLHPVGRGRLLGIGLDAVEQGDFALLQGIQISLFNVENPFRLTREDHSTFGGRGSFSHASSDRHAFFFNPDSSLLGVPMVEFDVVPSGSWEMGRQRIFSGAKFFEVDSERGRLSEKLSISHVDFVPPRCLQSLTPRWGWLQDEVSVDIQRIIQVDGDLVTLSPFGVKDWKQENSNRMTPLSAQKFSESESWCPHYIP